MIFRWDIYEIRISIIIYEIRRAIIADITNNITRTIVAINKNFSKPRLVLQLETASLPPNAPPAPASECCSRIKTVNITASTICIIESIERISIVGDSIADVYIDRNSNLGERQFSGENWLCSLQFASLQDCCCGLSQREGFTNGCG